MRRFGLLGAVGRFAGSTTTKRPLTFAFSNASAIWAAADCCRNWL